MTSYKGITRRTFIKTAAATGALVAFPELLIRKTRADFAKATQIHPNINDLLVVGLRDKAMTTETDIKTLWNRQNELVDAKAVARNMDRLACTLAATKSESKAWKTIFVKPPNKSWTDTVVAIKTNTIAQQHTRNAVMSSICRVLTDVVGVKGSNIHIYDGIHGGDMKKKSPFYDLPAGVNIQQNWGGLTATVAVDRPWTGGETKCVKALDDGTVDVLINIALCKGHGDNVGRFTMCCKNHMGSFLPGPCHGDGIAYIAPVNSSPQILGARDPKSGKILFPKQQLCIIDSLWASDGGPDGPPSAQPNFLAMGVLAPVVDYVIATRFRAGEMGWRINMKAATRLLEETGYSREDLPMHGDITPPSV